MSQGGAGEEKDDNAKSTMSSYEEAMEALSSLITKRSRADKSNKGDKYELLFDYIKMLELEEPLKQMKVIHVAGTKGKGSTCVFTESILRNCGFRTGLFTSPHLIDIRERFRLDGIDICEEKFLAYFWWCFDRFKERTTDEVPMPTYFRFLALLAFKIFAAEQVDVAILEVGLGGRYDATNVVENPVVCGVSSLGYDHMEILEVETKTLRMVKKSNVGTKLNFWVLADSCWGLIPELYCVYLTMLTFWSILDLILLASIIVYGLLSSGNTLGQIAGEKAGIFKRGVPAFTVPQPDEAMVVLEEKASELDVHLEVAAPLDANVLSGLHLGLEGEHQYINAGLAIALCSTWLQRTGHVESNYLKEMTNLPEQFVKGLATAVLQGRAQIVPDQIIESESPGDLVFYFDGAHSPESMDVCAKWFSLAIKGDYKQQNSSSSNQGPNELGASHNSVGMGQHEASKKSSTQILLFNCMSVRDPQLLLPRLMRACASQGVHFQKALFVPNVSVYYKVGTSASTPTDTQVDLSWQLTIQKIWENLVHGEKVAGNDVKNTDQICEELADDAERGARSCESSKVFPSLAVAINWLRDNVRRNRSGRFQVLVTGSLHLVGDVLRLVKK